VFIYVTRPKDVPSVVTTDLIYIAPDRGGHPVFRSIGTLSGSVASSRRGWRVLSRVRGSADWPRAELSSWSGEPAIFHNYFRIAGAQSATEVDFETLPCAVTNCTTGAAILNKRIVTS
jgi:hypothetical protein